MNSGSMGKGIAATSLVSVLQDIQELHIKNAKGSGTNTISSSEKLTTNLDSNSTIAEAVDLFHKGLGMLTPLLANAHVMAPEEQDTLQQSLKELFPSLSTLYHYIAQSTATTTVDTSITTRGHTQ